MSKVEFYFNTTKSDNVTFSYEKLYSVMNKDGKKK